MRNELLTLPALAVFSLAALAQGSQQGGSPPSDTTPANAKAATTSTAKKSDATPTASESAFLKITIDSSRSPISMDTEAGLSAEVKNVSAVPLRLYENETVFMTMPEMRIYGEAPQVIQGCATFPTQGNVRPTAWGIRGKVNAIPG